MVLSRALASIDWKKLASTIPDEPDFQLEVRNLFGALKADAQRKVSESIGALKARRGPGVTQTPVDDLISSRLVAKLTPLIPGEAAKIQLGALNVPGGLENILKVLAGNGQALARQPSEGGSSGLQADKKISEIDDLIADEWIYAFAPPRSKPMTFLPTGEIGTGRNAQESKWEYRKPYLVVLQETGEVGRAFIFDRGRKRWIGSSKLSSTLSSDGCYIIHKPKDKK